MDLEAQSQRSQGWILKRWTGPTSPDRGCCSHQLEPNPSTARSTTRHPWMRRQISPHSKCFHWEMGSMHPMVVHLGSPTSFPSRHTQLACGTSSGHSGTLFDSPKLCSRHFLDLQWCEQCLHHRNLHWTRSNPFPESLPVAAPSQ